MVNFSRACSKLPSDTIYETLKSGIFCLNKCKHVTSAQTVEVVKKALYFGGKHFRKLKVGHGGTLDSYATGILVIGIGHGCKRLKQYLHGDKCYVATGKFGAATDTYSANGKVTNSSKYCHISEKDIISCLHKFKGEILQTPPPYCALKRRGKRISDLVKAGEVVDLCARRVHCYSVECHKFTFPYFTLKLSCGGGFYVRSLVHDLGIALGSFAHVEELCRIKQGLFTLDDCLSCEDLSLDDIASVVSKLQAKCVSYD